MPRTAITGAKSTIAKKFKELHPEEIFIECNIIELPLKVDKYLICQGYLTSKTSKEQTDEERMKSAYINYTSIVQKIREVLQHNPIARVCIIGSESAYRGSYDDNYAKYKKLLHDFILQEPISYKQQLVGISPSIIEDAGMTLRRKDLQNLQNKVQDIPKKRFLISEEVAKMAEYLLYEQEYITGTIVRMHGGQYE